MSIVSFRDVRHHASEGRGIAPGPGRTAHRARRAPRTGRDRRLRPARPRPVERTTRDVDIVALHSDAGLDSADPLPQSLRAAGDLVARDFGLPTGWLNPGPAGLLMFGLPEGLGDRLERREYGEGLVVYFASRYDQIHFKLYAAVDQGPGKHEADLRALAPTKAELIAAARWSRSQDPSEGYARVLRSALESFGVTDVDL